MSKAPLRGFTTAYEGKPPREIFIRVGDIEAVEDIGKRGTALHIRNGNIYEVCESLPIVLKAITDELRDTDD